MSALWWEHARLARSQVLGTLAASCALAALFHYALAPLGERQDRIAFIGALVMLMIFNVATLLNCRDGGLALRFEPRLFLLPLSSSRLVTGRLLPALATVALMVLAQGLFMRLGVGARWPILGPLLLTMTVLAWSHALGWSLGGRPLLLFPAAIGALMLLRRWLAPRLRAEEPMATLQLGDAAVLIAAIAVASAVAVAGVRLDRAGRGSWLLAWTLPRWRRARTAAATTAAAQARAGAVLAPIGSPVWAQVWMEWREKGWILPVWSVAGLLTVAAINAATRSGLDRVLGVVLVYALFVGFLTPPIVGFMMGRFSTTSAVASIDPFRARRPFSDRRLAWTLLFAATLTLVATWVATGIAVESLVVALRLWSYPEVIDPGGPDSLGNLLPPTSEGLANLLGGVLLYAWTSMALTMSLAISGRNWVFASIAAGPYAIVASTLVAGRIWRVDLLSLLLPYLTALAIGAVPVAIVATTVACIRLRLVGRSCLALAAGWWLVAPAIALSRAPAVVATLSGTGIAPLDRFNALALPVALLLPPLPLLLAPLALWWNRHR